MRLIRGSQVWGILALLGLLISTAHGAVPPCTTYTTKAGDTIQKIASSFGVPLADLEASIQACDRTIPLNAIPAGTEICLPGAELLGCNRVQDFNGNPNCKVYTVTSTDDWPKVASTLNIDTVTLQNLNPEIGFSRLTAGMQLRLPPWKEKECGNPLASLLAPAPAPKTPSPAKLTAPPKADIIQTIVPVSNIATLAPTAAFVNLIPVMNPPPPLAAPPAVAGAPFKSPTDTIPDDLEAMYAALLTSPPPAPPPPPADSNDDTVILIAAIVGGVVALALIAIAALLLIRHRNANKAAAAPSKSSRSLKGSASAMERGQAGKQKSLKSSRSGNGTRSQRSYSRTSSQRDSYAPNSRQLSQTSQHSAYLGPGGYGPPAGAAAGGMAGAGMVGRQFSNAPGAYQGGPKPATSMGSANTGGPLPPLPPPANAAMMEDMQLPSRSTPGGATAAASASQMTPGASSGTPAQSGASSMTPGGPSGARGGAESTGKSGIKLPPSTSNKDIPYYEMYHTR